MKLSLYLDCLCDCIPRRRRAVHLHSSPSARNRFDAAQNEPPSDGNLAALAEHRRATAAFVSEHEQTPSSPTDLPSAPPPAAPSAQCRCFHFIPPDSLSQLRSVQPYFPWKPPSNQSFFPSSVLQTTDCMGFEFADGTSLPYVPMRNVTLHLRNVQPSNARFKRRSSRSLAQLTTVRLSASTHLYTQLVQSAQRAFRKSTASALLLPPAEHTPNRVTIDVHLNPCASEIAAQEDCMCTKLLAHCSTLNSVDLTGRALLMFCVQHHPDTTSAPLEIRLHRFQLHHDAAV